MILYTALMVFFLSGRVTSNCEYGRQPGLFKNSYLNSGDADFVTDTGADTNDGYGQSVDVTFSKQANIFSAHPTTFTIYDTGMINFGKVTGSTVTKTGTYIGTNGPFATTLLQQSFAAPLWLKDDSGDTTPIKYTFTYKLLKRADLVTATDLTTGPSMCDLQRIENIIFDCNDAGLNNRNPTGESRISEAVIVTWKITDGTKTYYMQAVVAIDGKAVDADRETYVIFLYKDPTSLPDGTDTFLTGFVNGLYGSSTQIEYAAVCPYKTEAVPSDIANIHTKSNCRCGSWNEGIFVFRTRDNSGATSEISNTCAKTQTALETQCALPLTDDHMQFQLACRPSRSLQDTCIEDIYCVQTPTANTVKVTVYLHKPRWTSYIYLDFSALPTITLMTSNTCKRPLTQEGTTGKYFDTLELTTTSPVCGYSYTAGTKTLNFALKTYDSTDNSAAELVKPGDLILKGTCEILPLDVEKDVLMNGYPTTELPAVIGRKVEMFINDRKSWDNALTSTKFAAGDMVDLGKDIFITVCYNTGSRAPVEGAEPYGIYVKDCMVANNAGFTTTGNNRMETLTTTAGCRTTYAQTANKAFYMESSFTESFYSTTVSTADYNHCQSSGKLDAAKWLVGGINNIYFRCNIGFCRNSANKAESKCVDSCGKTKVDFRRKKRDVNGTEDESPYPDVAVETFIRVVNPRYGTAEDHMECVDSTVAIGTLVALIVLLLVCIGLTSLMFFKVRSRQKKL